MSDYRTFGTLLQHGQALTTLPDQHGRVAIVTGGTDGVGRAMAAQLAAAGATTVLTARDQAKGARVCREIRAATGNDDVHVVALDLADLTSVRDAAQRVAGRWEQLHLLVANAGHMPGKDPR